MKNLLAILFVLCPVLCFAQDVKPTEAPKPNALFLRTGSSSAILVNYNFTFNENKVVWVGTLQDPHQDPTYREFQAGLGQQFGDSQVFVLALHASDGWYLQLVGLSSVTAGRLTLSAFLADYVPLAHGEARQLLIDPATVLVKVNSQISLGGSYTFYKSQGLDLKHAIGSTLKVSVPKGFVNIDLFEGLSGNHRREVRITLQLTF